jgi:4-hydroxy-3-polyprenylbenzoate decarboxylase
MIVIPCSSNTLSCVANGSAQNLLHRAAHVTLKERRRLILVHRETPLSLVDIRNMQAVTEAGAIVAPANPGFYMLPQTIDGLIDFVVGRCLDLMDIPHILDVRWREDSRQSADATNGGGANDK